MIEAHEMMVLGAIVSGKWTPGYQSGQMSAAHAEKALRRLVAARLAMRYRGTVAATDRGRALLAPVPVVVHATYVPPAALPVRAGAMAFARCPSVYAGVPHA